MNEFLGLVKDPVTQSEAPLLHLKLISGLHIHIPIHMYVHLHTVQNIEHVHICLTKVTHMHTQGLKVEKK